MGVEPILGRGFLPTEGAPSDEPVVIISEGLWRRDLAARSDVLGTTLTLGDVHRTIIGVATSTSLYPRIDVWIPTPLDAAGTQPVTAVAWLRSGVSRNRLRVELTAAVVEAGRSDQDLEVRLVPPDRRERASSSRVLILLWGASGFVLAIICANLATLLMARNLSRQRELSTCAALGASRIRIVRPLILECLLLGIAGGAFGILVTVWGGQALLWLRPRSLSFVYPDTMPLDASVLAYTLTLTCVMGVVIGVLASARWSRTDVLRGAGRDESYVSGRHGSRRLSSAAVVVQTALAVMVVVGAALMLTSFLRLRSLDPGFDPESVAELSFLLDPVRYADADTRRTFFQEVAARIGRLDGVTQAAVASDAPPHDMVMSAEIETDGRPIRSLPPVEASWIYVAPNYFRVLQIPIIEGRSFSDTEGATSVVVSRSFARRYWAAGEAIGERFQLHRATGPTDWFFVIGVAGDVSGRGLRDQYDEIYLPYSYYRAERGTILARTRSGPWNLLPFMRSQLWSVDPDVPDSHAGTLAASLAASIDDQRFYSALFGSFAVVAATLAALGVFGVASYAVARRRREIAVRLALGAGRSDIQRLVIRQAVLPSVLGTSIGLAGALSLSGIMQSLIHEVSSTDPLTYVSVVVAFFILSLLATWLPARRAGRVDPASLLRA